MKNLLISISIIILTGLIAASIAAEVPKLITYSGKLTDKQGNLVPDGDYDMKFVLWDHETSTADVNKIWEEQHLNIQGHGVPVRGAGFNIWLGGITSLPIFDKNYYLVLTFYKDGVWHDFNRQKIISVPYAIRAEYANHVQTPLVFHGSIDISATEGGNIYFYLDVVPRKVALFLKGEKINPLFYTEVGQHKHTHSGTHTHNVVLGSHSHAFKHNCCGLYLSTNSDASNFVDTYNSMIVSQDLGTKTSQANSPGDTDNAGLMPNGLSLHTGIFYEYLNNMRFLLDGVDKTADLLARLGWSKFGDGIGTHPFVINGTGFTDITSITNWNIGQHAIHFACSVGGRINYTLYIYY